MGSDKNKSGGYHILERPTDTTISSITPLSIIKNNYLPPSVAREMIFFYSHDPKKAAINSGKADYRYLSNWAWTPFVLDGIRYHSVEQYMMWRKARLFDDQVKSSEILSVGIDELKEPSTAKIAKIMATIKKKGREVSNYNEDVWVTQRYNIVLKGLIAKFTQNDDAKRVLLSTGDARLFEASSQDKVWGIGVNSVKALSLVSTSNATDLPKWSGSNLLGIALEESRATIRDSQ